MALLHSFAYAAAEQTFRNVAAEDPGCGMAHWGAAMTSFHPVWPEPLPSGTFASGQKQILLAQQIGSNSERERQFIHALGFVYRDSDEHTYRARAESYEQAMAALAAANRSDVESQVFYALALLASASPTDKTHAKQKQAIDVLLPLDRAYPNHPGIAHYLIHACDSQELALRGLPAARAYALIAPSAPHALHMPSHIFTRLGLWSDSIQSNLAARQAAHVQGDAQEELHAMDYLVYAYLQTGRDEEASLVIRDLQSMPKLEMGNFIVAYAATAMPIRYFVERGHWADAATAVPQQGAPPQVVAVAVWSRGLGLAHMGHGVEARAEADRLKQIEEQLRLAHDDYWSTQTGILAGEVMAWSAQANRTPAEAVALLRAAADQEDTLEKLPVTPGPILPAREQLGELFLEQNQSAKALTEFQVALRGAPGRLGSTQGAVRAVGTLEQRK